MPDPDLLLVRQRLGVWWTDGEDTLRAFAQASAERLGQPARSRVGAVLGAAVEGDGRVRSPADVAVGADEQGAGAQVGGAGGAYEVDPGGQPEVGRDGSGQVEQDGVPRPEQRRQPGGAVLR